MARQRPRLSMYARERIRQILSDDLSHAEIVSALRLEGISTCRQTVWRLERHIREHGTIAPLPKSRRPTKLTDVVPEKIDAAMTQDDETTAKELVTTLQDAGASVSLSTALKGRRQLGWTSRGTAYCQLVRAVNRAKRLRWAQEHLGANFDDVIWTDETSVQMETHRRFCCRKIGQKHRYKPRPKHPVKVHVWAGISWNGATNACIFEGIMDAELYCQILDEYLVPFIQSVYPLSHRFMQDNDPKHTSRKAQAFFAEKEINWWRTPPESPDANPIENMWHELKEYLRREVKPKTKEQLIGGIKAFWSLVTLEHGHDGTKASLSILKLLCLTVFSDRHCPVPDCVYIIPQDRPLCEHFMECHTDLDSSVSPDITNSIISCTPDSEHFLSLIPLGLSLANVLPF